MDSAAVLKLNEQQFTCLVKSEPVKQEDDHTVTLPPMVSVLGLKCLFLGSVDPSLLTMM